MVSPHHCETPLVVLKGTCAASMLMLTVAAETGKGKASQSSTLRRVG